MNMNTKLHDVIEYTVALISEFAERYKLTERQAYRYLNFHNGIAFLEENYGVIHTLSFREAVDSVARFCNRMGGKL